MVKQADKTNKATLPKERKTHISFVRQQAPIDNQLLQLACENPTHLSLPQRSQLQQVLGNRALSHWVGRQTRPQLSIYNDQASRILAQINSVDTKKEIYRSPSADNLETLWFQQGKGNFFNRLRQTNNYDIRAYNFVSRSLRGDDLWLARNILLFGNEKNWPIHLQIEREMKGWSDSGGANKVFQLLRDTKGKEKDNTKLDKILHQVFGNDPNALSLAIGIQNDKPARLMHKNGNEALEWLQSNSIPYTLTPKERVHFSPAITVDFSNIVSGIELHYVEDGGQKPHPVTPRLAVALVRLFRFLVANKVKILHHSGMSKGTHAKIGYAIDIAGFTFDNQIKIFLDNNPSKSSWNDNNTMLPNGMTAREFLTYVGEWMASTDFGQVLGPGVPRHFNHFHAQVPFGSKYRGFVHD